jgi:hypothetical protein
VRLSRVDYCSARISGDAPELRVRLDDKPMGVWRSGEPPLDVKANAGEHRLTVSAEGRKDFDGMIQVPKGQVLPLTLKMIPKYPRGAAWTQAVVAGVLIGGGVYAGLEARGLEDDLNKDRRRGTLEKGDSRLTEGKIYSIGADVAFLGGGIFAALSTYNFIKDPLPESSSKESRLVEFDDPLRKPTAQVATPKLGRLANRRRETPSETPAPDPRGQWHAAPRFDENSAGFVFGGSF